MAHHRKRSCCVVKHWCRHCSRSGVIDLTELTLCFVWHCIEWIPTRRKEMFWRVAGVWMTSGILPIILVVSTAEDGCMNLSYLGGYWIYPKSLIPKYMKTADRLSGSFSSWFRLFVFLLYIKNFYRATLLSVIMKCFLQQQQSIRMF